MLQKTEVKAIWVKPKTHTLLKTNAANLGYKTIDAYIYTELLGKKK